jgi:hypothetical protein
MFDGPLTLITILKKLEVITVLNNNRLFRLGILVHLTNEWISHYSQPQVKVFDIRDCSSSWIKCKPSKAISNEINERLRLALCF